MAGLPPPAPLPEPAQPAPGESPYAYASRLSGLPEPLVIAWGNSENGLNSTNNPFGLTTVWADLTGIPHGSIGNASPGGPAIATFPSVTQGIDSWWAGLSHFSNYTKAMADLQHGDLAAWAKDMQASGYRGGSGLDYWTGLVAAAKGIQPTQPSQPPNNPSSPGAPQPATTGADSCPLPSSALDVGGAFAYLTCVASKALPRAAAYLIGALLVVLGVVIILVDDVQVKGVSLKQTAKAVAE